MITTDRFIATTPTLDHQDYWHDLLLNSEVMHFIRTKPTNLDDVRSMYLDVAIAHEQQYGFTFCSIFDKSNGAYVGNAGIFHYGFDDTQPEIEIGCYLHKNYWAKGCAQELAQGFIDWGFANLAVPRIIAVANPLNLNSARVMQKLGMTYVGDELYCKKYPVVRYEIYRPA